MFEEPILRNSGRLSGEDQPRQELAWAELVARLAASRGLRSEFESAPRGAHGGFGEFSKFRRNAEEKGKPRVNRNALSDSKFDSARDSDEADNRKEQGDREA